MQNEIINENMVKKENIIQQKEEHAHMVCSHSN